MGKNISWKKKFKLDIYYVENQSIYLDFKIIFMTILYILKKIIKSSNSKEKIIEKNLMEKTKNIWPYVSNKEKIKINKVLNINKLNYWTESTARF